MSTVLAPEPDLVSDRSALSIAPCTPADKGRWDSYVEGCPGGTFFHLFGWGEVAEAAYGYEPVYLAARRGGAIVGVLPLIDVRSPLLGRSLISTAFTVGGGPVGDDAGVVAALAEKAARLGEERRVRYVEFRGGPHPLEGWVRKTGRYAGFKMPLPADEDEHMNRIPRRRRAEIRKALAAAEKGVLQSRFDQDADGFYELYARSMRALGTPVFPKRFLHEIVRGFGDRAELTFVDYGSAPAAALLSFYFRNTALPYYVGAAPSAREARAHEFLYWSLMRRAAARGASVFDFGRSKIGSGSYQFKKLWGLDPEPLTYQYKLIRARVAPDLSAANPKFMAASERWKRLPLSLANRLGPMLSGNFP